jgi:transcriptional regulator with XRE-family HTH domain
MSNIGARIKARRLELGWTLERLATEAKVSKGFLSDLENGVRKTAGGNYLREIANALQFSLDHLITGAVDENRGQDIQIPASLASFARQENLSFQQTFTLLQMRKQIIAFRSDSKSDDLENFDWRPLYDAVKQHLK